MIEALKKYIRSYVPGRLRLRHPGLKDIDEPTRALITETVCSAAGITSCTINPKVGSLLLTWDRHLLTQEDLLGYLSFWAAFIPGDALNEASEAPGETGVQEAAPATPQRSLTMKNAFEAGLDVLSPYIAPGQGSPARRRRVTQNRLMLAAGVGSVAALALRGTTHAYLGYVFTAMALWHLYQHRTVL